jgi:hypothetical protein
MPIRSKISGIARRSALNIGNFINSLRDQSPAAAAAFAQIETAVHAIENTLQRGDSTIEGLTITNPSGAEIIRLDPSGFISIHDQSGMQVSWLGEQADIFPLAITSATNASPSVITVTAHGYVNGDTVLINGATGNTAINGFRIVKNATANTFTMTDLPGVAINGNGAYAGSATAQRYYAGLLTQTIAIGRSFSDYKLRAFADGSFKIHDSSQGITTTIGNVNIAAVGVVGIEIQDDISLNAFVASADFLALYQGDPLANVPAIAMARNSTAGILKVYDGLGSLPANLKVTLDGVSGNVTLEGLLTANKNINTETGVYQVAGVSGKTVTRNVGTSITVNTGSAVTGTPGAGQGTGSFVTSVTLNLTNNAYTGGILTT